MTVTVSLEHQPGSQDMEVGSFCLYLSFRFCGWMFSCEICFEYLNNEMVKFSCCLETSSSPGTVSAELRVWLTEEEKETCKLKEKCLSLGFNLNNTLVLLSLILYIYCIYVIHSFMLWKCVFLLLFLSFENYNLSILYSSNFLNWHITLYC